MVRIEIYNNEGVCTNRTTIEKDQIQQFFSEHSFPGDFRTEIIDITEELKQKQEKLDAASLLVKTDYYIIREFETGVKCPEEVVINRINARKTLDPKFKPVKEFTSL